MLLVQLGAEVILLLRMWSYIKSL